MLFKIFLSLIVLSINPIYAMKRSSKAQASQNSKLQKTIATFNLAHLKDAIKTGNVKALEDKVFDASWFDEKTYTQVLFSSLIFGHTAYIKLLLDTWPTLPINIPDKDLYIAILQSNEYKLHELLKLRKTNLDIKHPLFHTPLSCACFMNDSAMVKLLLRYGANPNFHHQPEYRPLDIAIDRENLSIVTLLVESGASVNINFFSSHYGLIYAVSKDNYEIAHYLLSQGAKVNYINSDRITPLLIATTRGNVQLVELLLSYELDTNYCDPHGNNALMIAIKKGYSEIVKLLVGKTKLLVKNREGKSSLQLAIERGDKSLIKVLIEYGAHFIQTSEFLDYMLNIYDKKDLSLFAYLLRAITSDKKRVYEHLFQDLRESLQNAKNQTNTRAKSLRFLDEERYSLKLLLLDFWCYQNLEAFQFQDLPLEALKKADIVNHLKIISMFGYTYKLKQFVEYCKNHNLNYQKMLNCQDISGRTPLMYAIIFGHYTLAKELLVLTGSGVNIKDNQNDTALSYAIKFVSHDIDEIGKSYDFIKELLRYNAKFSSNYKIAQALKIMAIKGWHELIIKTLAKKSLNFMQANKGNAASLFQ